LVKCPMTLKERLTKLVVYFVLEQPARRQGLAKLTQTLNDSGEALHRDLERIEDTDSNRDHLRHIIAIEAWGQRRLKVALGERFVQDESHAYKPSSTASWEELKDRFTATRAETLTLAEAFKRTDVKQTAPHNQFGPLSVLAWLRYLENHARLEGKRLR
jgi:DinB superfamily